MTVAELIHQLNELPNHNDQVVVIWHGYIRDITGLRSFLDHSVELENTPRTPGIGQRSGPTT